MNTEIRHRTIDTNGIKLHIAEAGEGPLVLMIHGFPELWYSWRHQLPALAAAGYHAVAPDVRGYGDSDKPHAIEAYSMREIVADLLGVLDALQEETAVIVGHDWGSPSAWNSAVLHPDRYRAVVGMSVPYLPRSPMPPLQMMKAAFGDNFFYILYFQEPGVAEAEWEADVRRTRRIFTWSAAGESDTIPGLINSMAGKKKGTRLFDGAPEVTGAPPWTSEDDLEYYARAFEKGGFRGPINRYRCMDLDWEQLPELANARVTQPALFIAGDKDGVLSFAPTEPMKTLVPNLKTVMLPGAGHWTQQERPDEVNAELIAFLGSLT